MYLSISCRPFDSELRLTNIIRAMTRTIVRLRIVCGKFTTSRASRTESIVPSHPIIILSRNTHRAKRHQTHTAHHSARIVHNKRRRRRRRHGFRSHQLRERGMLLRLLLFVFSLGWGISRHFAAIHLGTRHMPHRIRITTTRRRRRRHVVVYWGVFMCALCVVDRGRSRSARWVFVGWGGDGGGGFSVSHLTRIFCDNAAS